MIVYILFGVWAAIVGAGGVYQHRHQERHFEESHHGVFEDEKQDLDVIVQPPKSAPIQ